MPIASSALISAATKLNLGGSSCHLETHVSVAKLKESREKIYSKITMRRDSVATQLRSVRKKTGLTQKEVAQVLGFESAIPVVRHERSLAIPSLLTALAYEIVFRVPIANLFRGLHASVESGIEHRLAELERMLQESDAKGRGATLTARKLEFLTTRKDH